MVVYSHPGRDLVSHLEGVTENLEHMGADYARILGMTHDGLKAHPMFQELLRGKVKRFSHAPGSALITYVWAMSEGLTPSEALLLAEAVRRHHGGMPDISDSNEFWGNKEVLALEVKKLMVPEVLDFIKEHVWDGFGEDVLQDALSQLPALVLFDKPLPQGGWDFYMQLRYMLSQLVAADRIDAVFGGVAEKNVLMPSLPHHVAEMALQNIQAFVEHAEPTPINAWRSRVRNEVLGQYDSYSHDRGVYRLVLPTGAGKTLISLTMALKAILKGRKRIIYVLPFISTGEQVANVVANMIGRDYVMIDNYLQKGKTDTDMLSQMDIITLIMRYWTAPVVVTTAVYMWEVLFAPGAMDLMNFHLLKDAVLIFDEVQAIPPEYWNDLSGIVSRLADSSLVVLMSATHPIDVKDSITLSTSEKIPVVRYEVSTADVPTPDDIKEAFEEDSSVLAIFNTRRGARDFFMDVEPLIPSDALFFLSTYIIPKDRHHIINMIKEREEKNLPRVLISTQVVEAGMDLSFKVLFRELAPLDSIIQSAGRCGRHGGYVGNVFVAWDESNIGKVYGLLAKDKTLKILSPVKGKVLPEHSFYGLVDTYFNLLKGVKSLSEITTGAIQTGKYSMSTVNYRIIKHTHHDVSVVIPTDEEVLSWIDEIVGLMKSHTTDKFAKLNRKRMLYARLSAYTVSVSGSIWKHVPGEVYSSVGDSDGLFYILPEYVSYFYHPKVGWNFFGDEEEYGANII